MEDTSRKMHVEGGDKEILYSKAIKAGKRIYYLDVKRNLKDDLFLAITESKKVQQKESMQVSFEKHKIFLYKEDFEKFMNGMSEVIDYIKQNRPTDQRTDSGEKGDDVSDTFKLDIEF